MADSAATAPPGNRLDASHLRSARWFAPDDLRSFGHRSRARQMGLSPADWQGRPVIAILNTWSDFAHCHLHFKSTAAHVKRGVLQAGGLPFEVPVLSLAEVLMKPTTMLHRNLLAMEAEEVLRSHPVDGAILLGGCDKTVPGLVMGALSARLPFIFVPAGPMLRGSWHGKVLGSGSDVWKYWDERRAGNLTEDDWCGLEEGIARSNGTCMTMGTASTLAAMAESMGLTMPGASSVPAVDSAHARLAADAGRQIVENVWTARNPSDFLTRASFDNAIVCDMAIGGSTNAVIHLVAIAGRAGIPLGLDAFDAISRRTPWLADIRPAGRFLMEDFHCAGGLRALLRELGSLLDLDAATVSGKSLGECLDGAEVFNSDVIRCRANPLSAEGGTAILRGSLAPDGAVIKHAAASPHLLTHTGPAVVFRDYNDLAARIDDPALDVTPESVLVLRNAGPVGAPGMPEWGMLPIPKKLLALGVRDIVRLSDARMSGTSYGTCVVHIAPESAAGGPLAHVRDGDRIALDVPNRRLDLVVVPAELERRRQSWHPPPRRHHRGYTALFLDQVTQASEGCDFRILAGTAPTPEPEIH
jgi:dihydroxy-acid dehydratase